MYRDLRSAIGPGTGIAKPSTTLDTLPPPCEVVFPGLFGWSPISTGAATAALGIDRGNWATWKCRGLTPPPLPGAWFRRASGGPLIYRVDHILIWLAFRRGEQHDTLAAWRHSLRTDFDAEITDPIEIRKQAAMYTRVVGPVVGSVRFTPAGFQAYLASLLSS